MRTGPLNRLATTASVVFLADFAAKQWALGVLAAESDRSPALGWHLAIVNNTRLAGGLQSAGLELPVTAILTTIVVVLVATAVVPQLSSLGGTRFPDSLLHGHGVVCVVGVVVVVVGVGGSPPCPLPPPPPLPLPLPGPGAGPVEVPVDVGVVAGVV